MQRMYIETNKMETMSISLRYSSLRCISMTNSSKSAERKQDMTESVCAQLHFIVRREMGVKLDKEYWCEHVQKSVLSTSKGQTGDCVKN
jgi:hypothetical protein